MRKQKSPDDPGKVTTVRRIGVELPDSVTAEIAEYVAGKPFLRETAVRDAVREAARTAAEEATVGNVAAIMARLLA
jgi:hypothetical protein